MSKFVEGCIKDIKRMTKTEIPELINNVELGAAMYEEYRMELNRAIIQACIGGEFTQNSKGENKIKFNKSLPTTNELAEIISLMDVYVKTVEIPYLNSIDYVGDDDYDEDMSIPNSLEIASAGSGIINIDKVNNKKVTNYIFGKNGYDPIMKYMLNASDIMKIAAIGVDLRKKTNRNTMIIIGGISIAVAAGIGYALYKYNSDKNDIDKSMNDVDLDDSEIELDEVDIDLDDAPVVSLDD